MTYFDKRRLNRLRFLVSGCLIAASIYCGQGFSQQQLGTAKNPIEVVLQNGNSVPAKLIAADGRFKVLVQLWDRSEPTNRFPTPQKNPFVCSVERPSSITITDEPPVRQITTETLPFPEKLELWLEAQKNDASLTGFAVVFDCKRKDKPDIHAKVKVDLSFDLKPDDVLAIDKPTTPLRLSTENTVRIKLTNKLAETIRVHIPTVPGMSFEPAEAINVSGFDSATVTVSTLKLDSPPNESSLRFKVADGIEQTVPITWRGAPWDTGVVIFFVSVAGFFVLLIVGWHLWPIDRLEATNGTLITAYHNLKAPHYEKLLWPRYYQDPKAYSVSTHLIAEVEKTVETTARHRVCLLSLTPVSEKGDTLVTITGRPKGLGLGRRRIKAVIPVNWHVIQTNADLGKERKPQGSTTNEEQAVGAAQSPASASRIPAPFISTMQDLQAKVADIGKEVATLTELKSSVGEINERVSRQAQQIAGLSELVKDEIASLALDFEKKNLELLSIIRAQNQSIDASFRDVHKGFSESFRKISEQLESLAKDAQQNGRERDAWAVRLLADSAKDQLMAAVIQRLSQGPSLAGGDGQFSKLTQRLQQMSHTLEPIAARLGVNAQCAEIRDKLRELMGKVSRVATLREGKPLDLSLSIKIGPDADKSVASQIASQLEANLSLMDDPNGEIQRGIDAIVIKDIPLIARICDNQPNARDFAPFLALLFDACGLKETTPEIGSAYSSTDHFRMDSEKGAPHAIIRVIDRGFKYNGKVIQQPKVVVGIAASF